MSPADHTILITGGTSPLPLALAESFLSLDNTVILTDSSDRKLDRAKRRLPDVIAIRSDPGDARDRDRLIWEMENNHRDLDILVNAVVDKRDYHSVAALAAARDAADEIEANLTAAVDLSARLLPLLLKRPQAAIINLIPAQGLAPDGRSPVQSAAKAGLHMFGRSLRESLRDTAVAVVDVIQAPSSAPPDGKRRPSLATVVDLVFLALAEDRHEIKIGQIDHG